MNNTSILWTEKTWNPVTGCQPVSAGCAHCYARTVTQRFRQHFPRGFRLHLHPERLLAPMQIRQPALIFVNSMSDLFWEQIPLEFIDRVVDVIEATPRHTYQVLTKRPGRLLEYARTRPLPANFWAGVTVENQATRGRLDVLRQIPAAVRFVSIEPLLEPIAGDFHGIDQVIVGGESGAHLLDPRTRGERALVDYGPDKRWTPRPQRMPWVRELRDQAKACGAAFLFKQWGGLRPDSGGRTLDGRTWDEFPHRLTS